MKLSTSIEAALVLCRSRAWVQHTARLHGVGWLMPTPGRGVRMFTPQDLERLATLRDRPRINARKA